MILFSTTITTILYHIIIMDIVKYGFIKQSKLYNSENDYLRHPPNIICKNIFLIIQVSVLMLKRLNTTYKIIFSREHQYITIIIFPTINIFIFK